MSASTSPSPLLSKKYVCIHGHFYQPPRENAWLETIEHQPSAAPFHNWNERINFECYAPNAVARLLGTDGRIKDIVNNYGYISYNFGPTLLSWLQAEDPDTYHRILQADKESVRRFSGHGSALAQSYNHMIMPLANERDKRTQVKWGIADFKHRFNRMPEGMWLAETAVDTATLEIMAEEGLLFTVLAPRQAAAVKLIDGEDWHDTHGTVDSRRAYLCKLPSGRSISIFFYDGDVSQAVAFEGLLNDGHRLANRISDKLDFNSDEAQLAHIATDGESYGHHHKQGEMALAAALDHLDKSENIHLTVYGEFLANHPPQWEVRIHENSSWSCVHGVERWRSDCGCHTGGEAHWNQAWRGPLRDALDYVREIVVGIYEERAPTYFKDHWGARDEYIQLVLDRNSSSDWLEKYGKSPAGTEDTSMLRLLEMQRHAMLMYTSCGWFFNEVSGIETLQILQYALRALHLARVITGQSYETEFEERLATIPSNKDKNAAVSYLANVKPARVGLTRVAMHFAAASLFEAEPEALELFNYRASIADLKLKRAGTQRLSMGRISIQSLLTFRATEYDFAVLYLGQHHVIGSLSEPLLDAHYQSMGEELEAAFQSGNVGQSMAILNRYFGNDTFSTWHLFRDEKRKILLSLSERNLEIAAKDFADIYYDNYQLMTELRNSGMDLPEAFVSALDFILPWRLQEALAESPLDIGRLHRAALDVAHWEHEWSEKTAERLNHEAEIALLRELDREIKSNQHFEDLGAALSLLKEMKLNPNLWQCQNRFFSAIKKGEVNEMEQSFSDYFQSFADLLNFADLGESVQVA
ncbi:MAG: DUF3536 domain-containing protein [Bacteroidota bacterium]